MSIKKAMEFMKKTGEKFTPIKIDDEELIKDIEAIRDEKNGFYLLLLDLAKARNKIDNKIHRWFDKVMEKYNIPEKYRDKITYLLE